jgi:hypothetical protein
MANTRNLFTTTSDILFSVEVIIALATGGDAKLNNDFQTLITHSQAALFARSRVPLNLKLISDDLRVVSQNLTNIR